MSDPKPAEISNNFKNKNGQISRYLRIKEKETLAEAVARLTSNGWNIPDISQLKEESDEAGKYFIWKS